jgi:hypothetical protein
MVGLAVIWQLGNQWVGIVKEVPVLDTHGNPVVSAYMEPETTQTVTWKPNCCLEPKILSPRLVEQETGGTTVTREVGHAFLPVDADTTAITSAMWLQDGGGGTTPNLSGPTYEMRGEALVEVDIRGNPDHVYCLIMAQKG